MILVSVLLMIGMITTPILNADATATLTGVKITVNGTEQVATVNSTVYSLEVENTVTSVIIALSTLPSVDGVEVVTTISKVGDTTPITGNELTLEVGENPFVITVQDKDDETTLANYSLIITRKESSTSTNPGTPTEPDKPTEPDTPTTPDKTDEQKMNELIKAVEAIIADSEELGGFVKVDGYHGKTISFVYSTEFEDGTLVNTSAEVVVTDLENANKVVEDLKTKLDSAYIQITPPETNVLTKTALELMKLTNQYFYFYVNSDRFVEWAIDGAKVTDEDTEVKLNVFVGDEVNEELRKSIESLLVDKTKSLVLDFEHSGKLPEGTNITMYVGDKFKEGDTLSLYFYNTSTKKLEEKVKNIKVKSEGYVTFYLEHCSSYVLSKTTNNAATGTVNVVLYSSVLVIALTGIVVLLKKKNN